ncbi:MAG: redox-sensing transcriptional repressor Rex [Gemmatimonadales bacterium]|nr:redox-sensing transcriptional repressor Rex [Gemmatimonadota bacterium]MCL4214294.1 redox-sensing transcriptional repressor Rex [Gemmatimonadales bacterium]
MKHIAESTVRRLSLYLRFLEEGEARAQDTISSGELARLGGTTSAQVRKDLSFFGSFGKRGLGYHVKDLIEAIREILGLDKTWPVVIVGAGKIGAALAQYRGFSSRGFRVVGVYDRDPARIGQRLDGLTIRAESELERDIAKLKAQIAVLCVPSEAAQVLLDRVTKAGIRAVLNFAPSPLRVPKGVALRSVNMATELEILTFALTNRIEGGPR